MIQIIILIKMSSKLFHIVNSGDNFSEEISKHGVCVVDFFATWCVPCTALAKNLTISVQNDTLLQQVRFIKVDVDEFPDLAELYNVSALPYLIFFKDGKLTEYFVKGSDENKVISIVKQLLIS